MANITIVIVNYNGIRFQEECVKSLYDMKYKDFDILIVDSGSTDGSMKVIEERYPNIKIIKCHENIGVAKGNNIGIRYSIKNGSKYTLLSNNDIVVDSHIITELLKYADEDTITVPKIYYYEPSDVLWYAGGEMNWKRGVSIHYGDMKKDVGDYDEVRSCSYSPTCFMLIPNSVFENVGLVDENYFMYCDDTDLCVRVLEKGYTIKYVPTAFMWHKVSSSSGGVRSKTGIYYAIRNQLYFNKKYREKIRFLTAPRMHFRNWGKFLLFPFVNPFYKYIPRAYKDFWLGRMGRADDL